MRDEQKRKTLIYEWSINEEEEERRKSKLLEWIVESRFFSMSSSFLSHTHVYARTQAYIHTTVHRSTDGIDQLEWKKSVQSFVLWKKNEGEVFLGLFNSFILHLLVQHLIRKLNGLPYGPQTGRFWNCWCLLHSDFFFFSNGLSIVSRAIVRQRRTATIVVLSSMSKSL